MTAVTWEAELLKHLTEAGIESAEAVELARDAVTEAEVAGLRPDSMYGPAMTYAATSPGRCARRRRSLSRCLASVVTSCCACGA